MNRRWCRARIKYARSKIYTSARFRSGKFGAQEIPRHTPPQRTRRSVSPRATVSDSSAFEVATSSNRRRDICIKTRARVPRCMSRQWRRCLTTQYYNIVYSRNSYTAQLQRNCYPRCTRVSTYVHNAAIRRVQQ